VEVLLLVAEERVDEYLGVGYLTAALRAAGASVRVAQWERSADRCDLEAWLRQADSLRLVGIPWLYIFSEPRVVEVARLVKEVRPEVSVVVGGHPVTFECRRALRAHPTIDYVIRGEGDYAIVELLTAIRDGVEPAHVAGLAYRGAGGEIVETSPRGQIADLDALPQAARDTLLQVLDTYEDPATVVVRMISSRGCYARCEFCSMVAFYDLDGAGMKWRPRGVNAISDELKQIRETMGLRRFWFGDDELVGPPKVGIPRLMALAERIRRDVPGIEWGFDARANGIAALTSEQLTTLRDAGLRVVAMGLESGSQAALRRMNKGMDVRSNWRAIEALRAAGIDYRYGFIMYDPGTTLADLQQNLEFLDFAEPHRICNTGPYRLLNAEFPEVGTPLAKRLNIVTHAIDTTRVNNFPKLEERSLGYAFADPRISRFRRLCHAVASDVIEPKMIPRPVNEPPFRADTWWTGINYQPRNVDAMHAFLSTMGWLLENVDHVRTDDELISELTRRFESDFGELQDRRPASAPEARG
jgi:hypothetical protein